MTYQARSSAWDAAYNSISGKDRTSRQYPLEPTDVVLARLQAIAADKRQPQGDPLPVQTHVDVTMPQTTSLKQARRTADDLIRAKGGQVPPERTL